MLNCNIEADVVYLSKFRDPRTAEQGWPQDKAHIKPEISESTKNTKKRSGFVLAAYNSRIPPAKCNLLRIELASVRKTDIARMVSARRIGLGCKGI